MKGDSVITEQALVDSVFTPYYFSEHQFIDERKEASAAAAVFHNFGFKQIGEDKR